MSLICFMHINLPFFTSMKAKAGIDESYKFSYP